MEKRHGTFLHDDNTLILPGRLVTPDPSPRRCQRRRAELRVSTVSLLSNGERMSVSKWTAALDVPGWWLRMVPTKTSKSLLAAHGGRIDAACVAKRDVDRIK
jgi:hypothetical protein